MLVTSLSCEFKSECNSNQTSNHFLSDPNSDSSILQSKNNGIYDFFTLFYKENNVIYVAFIIISMYNSYNIYKLPLLTLIKKSKS